MEIKEPSVELIPYTGNVVEHVAKCARVCYNKESGDDEKTYKNLIKQGHLSMFRHATYYAAVPVNKFIELPYFFNIHTGAYLVPGIEIIKGKENFYVAYNGNYALDNSMTDLLEPYLVSPEEFEKYDIARNLMRYTFRIVTQNCTAKELNRVSPNNIAELSSRRVHMNAICKPWWMKDIKPENKWIIDDLDKTSLYLQACSKAFDTYDRLISLGVPKEDARGVLPLDTATTCIYTYSIEEWRHIIKLRTDKSSHKNCQIIADLIKRKLKELGYKI